MSLTFGLEQEFFVQEHDAETDTNVFTTCPTSVPADEIGFLAEARGLPGKDIVEAVFNLKAEIYRITEKARKANVILVNSDIEKIPRNVVLQARRMFAKGLVHHKNMYGHEEHRNPHGTFVAGIHISFVLESIFKYTGPKEEHLSYTYRDMFDYIKYFVALDKAFATEIKAAKRLPGFYELKGDGRIEYRSLPATASHSKIIEVIQSVK